MRKRKVKIDKVFLKNQMSAVFEMPEEIVLDVPIVSFKGKDSVSIENYKGIVEYSSDKIRINTSVGVFKIVGENLLIKCIDSDNVIVYGIITGLEYL